MSVSLAADGVTHQYAGVKALDCAGLQLEAGHAAAIVGESGSGKTTLLRCFNRMVEPDEGDVRVGGENVRTLDAIALRRRLGYVQQHGGLIPHWSVEKNVGMVLRSMGRHDARAVTRSMEMVGLEVATFATRFPNELSGGQRQRVALARALAAGPEALLLDEPFGALDAISRAEVQETFFRVQRELGLTMILVTHDLSEAAKVATDIVVMRRGRIEQRGAIEDLAHRPATAYVAELVRAALASSLVIAQ